MSAKVISSGHLQLFPRCGSQLPFSSRLSTCSTTLQPRRRSGPFRITARAATYAPIQTPAETFYDMLGISETGSISDIKKAYKQLARKYHPDVSPPDRTEEYTKRFIKVQEAYETLSDPHSRALYDTNLARGLHLAFSTGRRHEVHIKIIKYYDLVHIRIKFYVQMHKLSFWSIKFYDVGN